MWNDSSGTKIDFCYFRCEHFTILYAFFFVLRQSVYFNFISVFRSWKIVSKNDMILCKYRRYRSLHRLSKSRLDLFFLLPVGMLSYTLFVHCVWWRIWPMSRKQPNWTANSKITKWNSKYLDFIHGSGSGCVCICLTSGCAKNCFAKSIDNWQYLLENRKFSSVNYVGKQWWRVI